MFESSNETEQQLIVLKSRLFDAQESAQKYETLASQYSTALAQVAANLGVTGEQIQLTEIVSASEKFKQEE